MNIYNNYAVMQFFRTGNKSAVFQKKNPCYPRLDTRIKDIKRAVHGPIPELVWVWYIYKQYSAQCTGNDRLTNNQQDKHRSSMSRGPELDFARKIQVFTGKIYNTATQSCHS